MGWYSSKDIRKLKGDLDMRITISEGYRKDPFSTGDPTVGNQITIMETLKLLLNTLPEPYDPGPNG